MFDGPVGVVLSDLGSDDLCKLAISVVCVMPASNVPRDIPYIPIRNGRMKRVGNWANIT
jgi:hypothetical protein